MIRGYTSEDDIRNNPPESPFEWEHAFAVVWESRKNYDNHCVANVVRWTIGIVGNALTKYDAEDLAVGATIFAQHPESSLEQNKSYLADMAEAGEIRRVKGLAKVLIPAAELERFR
jgi:hypothetical protein